MEVLRKDYFTKLAILEFITETIETTKKAQAKVQQELDAAKFGNELSKSDQREVDQKLELLQNLKNAAGEIDKEKVFEALKNYE